jgi:hypothetical protein
MKKNGNGNENFSISDDGVWQRLSRPATGRRERGVSETRRFEKRSRHTVEAWRLSNGLVGRVVMTCDRKKFPLVENFLSPNFENDGS